MRTSGLDSSQKMKMNEIAYLNIRRSIEPIGMSSRYSSRSKPDSLQMVKKSGYFQTGG